MSSYIFDKVKSKVADGSIKFLVPDNTFYIALVDESVFVDFTNGSLSNSEMWAEISSSEITNNAALRDVGYEIRPLVNIRIKETDVHGFTTSTLEANDIVYPVSDIDAFGAVIFQNSSGGYVGGSPTYNGPLITAIDFESRVSSTKGTFTMYLSKGFLKLV